MKNFFPPCAGFSIHLNACMTELFFCIPESFYPPSVVLPPTPCSVHSFLQLPSEYHFEPIFRPYVQYNTTFIKNELKKQGEVAQQLLYAKI